MGNFFGAFADTAVLLPLLATLSIHNGMSFALLLFSAGILYFVSGYFYKIPMSVQPLKSIAIAGITLGASAHEIRISGALLGFALLGLLFLNLRKIEEHIPKVLIHGIQLSLGILLITQGCKQIPGLNAWMLSAGILSILLLLLFDRVSNLPALGWFSVIAIIITLYNINFGQTTLPAVLNQTNPGLRWGLIFSLILPQFFLTINNSVLATKDVSGRYFGKQAQQVTTKNLLSFIGIGNLLMAVLGGLPFCHGSGGITAHFKGGSRSAASNYIIGTFLLALGIFSYVRSIHTLVLLPVFLFIILTGVGLFHLKLARPSWQHSSKSTLIAMAMATLYTQNILISFIAGLTVYFAEKSICLAIKKPL